MPPFANRKEGLRFRIVLGPGVALGPGKADLLEAIRDTGSLTRAAATFGMSYKRGWTLVQEMNRGFANPLVETEKGGSGGGGSARLTDLGNKVLERYRQMERDANRAIADGIDDLRRHVLSDVAHEPSKSRKKVPL
jgi:molybdate transport system regulatory protein